MLMRALQIGPAKVTIPAIGLGCMGMSEFYGPTNDAESIAALVAAHSQGALFVDTSDMYGRGHNETLLGSYLKSSSGPYNAVVATKFGIVRDSADPYRRGIDNSRDFMFTACEGSLRRLQHDAIDLYYIHRIDSRRPIEDTVGDLSRLVDQGKVRGIGLCEASADTIRRAHAVHPLTAVQNEYSLFTRDVEREILPTCIDLGVAFVACSPLGRGLLTEQVASFDDGDVRRSSPRLQRRTLSRSLNLVETARDIARRHHATLGQVALAWLLSRSEFVIPIPGTRRASRVLENMAAADLALSGEELSQLGEAFSVGAASGSRYTMEGGVRS